MEEFNIQLKCLKLLGYEVHLSDTQRKINWRLIFVFFNISVMLIVIPFEGHYQISHIDDIQLFTDATGPMLTCILAIIKLITFYRYRLVFVELITNLKNLVKDEVRKLEYDAIVKLNKFDRIVANSYLICCGITGAGYIGVGIYYNFLANEDILSHREMPFKASFIFDITKSPVFEILYVVFIYATWITILGSVGVDTLFFGFVLNIIAHFKILQKRFHIFFDEDSNVSRMDTTQLFKYHQRILGLSKEMNRIYAPIVFAQCFITSLILCVIGFQLVTSDDIMKKFVQIAFLCAILIQLFVYAFGGDILSSESTAVYNAVYFSKWYDAPQHIKKDLLLTIMRAQIKCTIKSGYFEASLATFGVIIKNAFSFMTLLQSLIEK